jgi:hypothetical protein
VVGAAAAAILVVWGVPAVISGMPKGTTGSNALSGSGDFSAEQAPAAPALPGGPPTMRSGRDYQPGTLAQLAPGQRGAGAPQPTPTPAPAPAAAPGVASKSSTSTNDSSLQANAADPLGRLANPDALRACLAAIEQAHAGTPTVVDFAKFQEMPALVVVIQQPSQAIAVVVGPACGQNGPDERFSTTIGP